MRPLKGGMALRCSRELQGRAATESRPLLATTPPHHTDVDTGNNPQDRNSHGTLRQAESAPASRSPDVDLQYPSARTPARRNVAPEPRHAFGPEGAPPLHREAETGLSVPQMPAEPRSRIQHNRRRRNGPANLVETGQVRQRQRNRGRSRAQQAPFDQVAPGSKPTLEPTSQEHRRSGRA
ncbi:hypothetical protein D3C87_1480050 [compost metagenome]